MEIGFNQDECSIEVVTVLVEGQNKDYAVYIGHGSSEWIAKHGNKLSFNEAQIHFPSIKRSHYRG